MKIAKVLIVFVVLATLLPIQAAEKKTYALSKRVYKMLNEVSELIDQKAYSQAFTQIELILARKLSDYERAQTWFIKGSVYYQQGQIEQTYRAFENVVVTPEKISDVLRISAYRSLTQLSLSQDKLDKALHYGKQLIIESNQLEADHALLAQVYYKQEQYLEALTQIQQSINNAQLANKVPKENVFLLQNAIYYELEHPEKMLEVLKKLTLHYPKATYLLYMASVYGQLGDMEKQTVIMETLYEDDQLNKDNQFINLASLYIAQQVPYKGAKLLANAIKANKVQANKANLNILSQAWLLAAEKDKAIAILGKAAELSDDGELYLQQAYLYFDDFDWQHAISAADKALKKGLVKDKQQGEPYLIKAMAYTNLKQFNEAIVAANKALELESSKKLAKQWLRYIRSEQDKFKQLSAF